jgi:hypothetical protein
LYRFRCFQTFLIIFIILFSDGNQNFHLQAIPTV